MKFQNLIIIALALSSCTSNNSYQYIERLRGRNDGSDLHDKLPEKFEAISDSQAYVKACGNFCVSKYSRMLTSESQSGITLDEVVTFKLLNSSGQDIAESVLFNGKDSIQKAIAEPIALRVAEIGKGSAKILNELFADSTFEVMLTDHNSSVQNFHVYLKADNYDEPNVQLFLDKFRAKFCKSNCNISIYDERVSTELLVTYPLQDRDYLKLADHFIATSTFEESTAQMYPYQDVLYKKLGGKNWKKKSVD